MGFWSSVGSFCSSVCGGISSACSAICSGVASIGAAVSSFCATCLPAILTTLGGALSGFGAVLGVVALALKIFRPGEKMEDIGDRALQAAEQGITYKLNDNFDEYMDKLRNLKLDPEKSKTYSMEQKMAAGITVTAAGMSDRLNASQEDVGKLLVVAAKNMDYFGADTGRLMRFIDAGKSVGDIIDFFDGRMASVDAAALEKRLVAAERAASPEKTEESIYVELGKVRDSFAQKETLES